MPIMTYRQILVPFDGSQYSEKALDLASRLAKDMDAQLHILHVVEELPATPRMEREKVVSVVTGEIVAIREYIKELYQQAKREAMTMLERKSELEKRNR